MASPWPGAEASLAAGVFLVACWAYRALIWRRTKQFAAFPQFKPSLLWGHAHKVNEMQKRFAPDAHPDYAFKAMHEELGSPGYFFVDFRPISHPMLMLADGALAEQLSRPSKQFPYSVNKWPTLGDLVSLIGRRSILLLEGENWKAARKHFNVGFAPKHCLVCFRVFSTRRTSSSATSTGSLAQARCLSCTS